MIPINIYEKPKVLKTKTIALVLSFKVVVMVSLICFCKNYIYFQPYNYNSIEQIKYQIVSTDSFGIPLT